jgi:hypothetical protein
MSEITVHNVADTIREKVKTYIFEVMPQEQLNGLIQKVWEEFFKDKSTNWEKKPSEFELLVKKSIEKYIQEKVDESIKKELSNMQSTWDGTAQKVIGESVKTYAPIFLSGLAEAAVSNILQTEKQRRGIY